MTMTRQEQKCGRCVHRFRAGKKTAEIKLPPLKLAKMTVEIVGDSPLVVHRYDGAYRKKPLPPKEQFESARFRFKKGRRLADGYPASGVKIAMAVAGYRYLSLKDKVSTLGAISILGEGTTIRGRGDGPGQDLVEINFKGKKPVRRGDTTGFPIGNPSVMYRAGYPKWSMKLVIRYISNDITPQTILHLLNTAGHAVGLGEWRPEKKGQFGMFHVKMTAALHKLTTARKAG